MGSNWQLHRSICKERLVVDAANADIGDSGMTDVAARLPMTWRRLTWPANAMLAVPYPPPRIAEGSKASPEISSKTSTMVRKVASSRLP
jgi:hypothetical protein